MSSFARHLTRLSLPVALLGISACSSDGSTELTGIGTLTVSLDSDMALRLPSGEPAGIDCGTQPETDDIAITLTDQQGHYAHTWESFSKFPQEESYFAGSYSIDITCGDSRQEGFDRPAFTGNTTVTVMEKTRTDAVVTLTPVSAFFTFTFSPTLSDAFPSVAAVAHTPGGSYFTVSPSEKRQLCLTPGETGIFVTLDPGDGKEIIFKALSLPSTSEATIYEVELDADVSGEWPVVTVSAGGKSGSCTLTPDFIAATPPGITFTTPDGEIALPEGDSPESPVIATVNPGGAPIDQLLLTTRSVSLNGYGFPAETDLLHPGPGQKELLERYGLDVTEQDGKITVDFTELLGNLVYLTPGDAVSTFSLMAVDSRGSISLPATLKVVTTPVEIQVMEATPAVMCIDRTTVKVSSTAPGFERHVEVEVENTPGHWKKADVTITDDGDSFFTLGFAVPEGSSPVNARVLYCNEVRSTFTIERVMPEFNLRLDGFAKTINLEVSTPDPALTSRITERLSVYINGEPYPVYRRFSSEGVLTVIGLSPLTAYNVKTTLMDGVEAPEFTPTVRIVTEGTPQLPNNDFEERKDGPRFKNMPSGGVYAQTSVDIFNWQHHTTYKCEVPKEWANTNAKTFNLSASNINTWYVQPSVRLIRDDASSGSFSVLLTSVAYDPAGEDIPPYAQTGEPYLDYSPVVPHISHRAAGKLFLGEYSFNAATGEETYREGVAWNSRPYSVSGTYKYLPSAAERDDDGLVVVEVIGKSEGQEVVIASGKLLLPYAGSFTAFNVPLSYSLLGVKATRLKLMFASSSHIGTIEEESANVTTVADPQTATSTGGKLWIDNIQMTY